MNKALSTIIFTSVFCAAAQVAYAQSGGVEVGGDIKQVTLVGKSTNVAVGKNVEADTKIGSIGKNTKVGGDLKQVTLVGQNTNVAVGKNVKAKTRIGDIRNTEAGGDIKQVTLVGSSTNVGVGKNVKATQSIGTIGE